MEPLPPLRNRRYKLSFYIGRSIRYHEARQHFFWKLHLATSMLAVLMAGSTLYQLGSSGVPEWWLVSISLGTSLLLIIDFVVRFAESSVKHKSFKSDWVKVGNQLKRLPDVEDELKSHLKNFQMIDGEISNIEATEPPGYGALDLICHNMQAMSDKQAREVVYDIPWWARWTCNFFRWENIMQISKPLE